MAGSERPPRSERRAREHVAATRAPHVAVVSFGYPPIPHVSGTRAAEMSAQLRTLGFDVTVVTADWRSADVGRPTETIERGVHVIRVDPTPWHPQFNPAAPPFTTEPPEPRPFVRRWRTLRATLGWGPYERWARAALDLLLRAHAIHPVDVVWAIHGDDSSHEIALRFHRATRVPWIADFKDPWNAYHHVTLWPLQWAGTRRRTRTASAVTETARAQGEADKGFGRPWHVVWSGYDADMMAAVQTLRSSTAFSLGYFGNVGAQHDVEAMTNILAQWSRNSRIEAEVHVFGHEVARWRQLFGQHGILPMLRPHPVIPRDEAFARMKGMDVLILLPSTNFGRSRVLVGVKELEYMASGSPILVFGRLLPELLPCAESNPAQVLQAHHDESALQFLDAEYARFARGEASARRAPVNAPSVVRYSWPYQARLLAEVLRQTAGW